MPRIVRTVQFGAFQFTGDIYFVAKEFLKNQFGTAPFWSF